MLSTNQKSSVDICFVLDATRSTQSVFTAMIEQVNDISYELSVQNRSTNFHYGSVIYRDPVDYRKSPENKSESDIMRFISFENIRKYHRIWEMKKKGLYNEEYEQQKEENAKKYDRNAFPINKNVPIPFKKSIESLIVELMKVECDGGNDDPEDWVGALNCALHELEWRKNSKKCIIWIADANAHGKRFCGYDNHNEEEDKLPPLVKEMAEKQIYFAGINIMKDNDDGCRLTLHEIKDIYLSFNGPYFVHDEFKPKFDELYNCDNDWPSDVLNNFIHTLKNSLSKINKVLIK